MTAGLRNEIDAIATDRMSVEQELPGLFWGDCSRTIARAAIFSIAYRDFLQAITADARKSETFSQFREEDRQPQPAAGEGDVLEGRFWFMGEGHATYPDEVSVVKGDPVPAC